MLAIICFLNICKKYAIKEKFLMARFSQVVNGWALGVCKQDF